MYLYLSKTDVGARTAITFDVPGQAISPRGEIGLAEIYLRFNKATTQSFDLLCDLCDTSMVGNRFEQILRRVHVVRQRDCHITFDPVFYLPVIKEWTPAITLYIRVVQPDDSSVELKTLSCALHMKS